MKEFWVLLKAYQAEVDCFLPTWYINATCIELVWISLTYNVHTYGSYYILPICRGPIGAIC